MIVVGRHNYGVAKKATKRKIRRLRCDLTRCGGALCKEMFRNAVLHRDEFQSCLSKNLRSAPHAVAPETTSTKPTKFSAFMFSAPGTGPRSPEAVGFMRNSGSGCAS